MGDAHVDVDVDVAPGDESVLARAPSVLEVPVGTEAVLWGPAPVPLHLNPSALATWSHFDGETRLAGVLHGIADTFRVEVGRVAPGVRAVASMLLEAGVLVDAAVGAPEPATAPPAARAAAVDAPAAAWLERRVAATCVLAIGSTELAVAASSELVARAVRARFAELLGPDDRAAPIRYLVVDAGVDVTGAEVGRARHWLLSDTGLPLAHAAAVDEVLDRLAEHLGEVLAVQSGAGPAFRLGVLEGADHCVAVQWDLLAARPVLEGPLAALGYRITSRQWAIVDVDRLAVLPVAPIDRGAGGADVAGGAGVVGALAAVGAAAPLRPLRALVLWFGPGSIDPPRTLGEWVWSLVMAGCAGADHRPTDREALVRAAHQLATTTALYGLVDAGPTELLAVLGEVAGGARR